MRGVLFLIWVDPNRTGRADFARFARLTLAGKSGGHALVSPADLPTKIS